MCIFDTHKMYKFERICVKFQHPTLGCSNHNLTCFSGLWIKNCVHHVLCQIQFIKTPTHLLMPRLLSGVVLAAEPPVHEDPPELHVEDDGVASEEADLLLQQGSLLSPGHLMTLESLQLQGATLGLQTQTLVFLLGEGSEKRWTHVDQ